MNQSRRPDDAATPNDHLARLISSTGAGNAQLLGESLLGAGRVTEAQKLFQQLVFLQPEHAASRAGLGLAMMAAGSTEAALATLARALELDPQRIETAAQVLYAHENAGRADAAAALLRDAIERWPDLTHLRLACSQALRSLGRLREALEELLLAARLSPRSADVWRMLTSVQLMFPAMAESAVRSGRRFLELAPGPQSRSLLAEALHLAGHGAEAREQLILALPTATWSPERHRLPGEPLRIAVLTTIGVVHTPLRFLFEQFGKRVDWIPILDGVSYPAEAIGRSYDVFVNAMADADMAASALRQVSGILGSLPATVINRPDEVLETTRDRMAARLADVPGAVVPHTARLTRAELYEGGGQTIPPTMGFPLLLREVGSHGGSNITRVHDANGILEFLETGTAEEFYLTAFVDFASTDGAYRKFRVAFVDGVPFPYHLSISSGWLNHYFRSRMAENEAFRAEEARFLANPDVHLGALAMSALREIGRRVELDYFGVDFALDRDGRLVLFECNAVMLIAPPQVETFRYRHEAAARIRDAFSEMLRARAAAAHDMTPQSLPSDE